ncbi:MULTISPECIES: putative holin-like toxin [Lactococcus]|nr:putative holin-like toxin [Lactococcus petauri]MDC0814473.1 putative holin-like toxin [Lactococcus petauri]MDQ7137377.1 putative holin-like toxin [Lactococcus petauri]USI70600.1 putative holin-like toxin [Lactococcus garvieae subsp. garvieae]
MSVYEALSLMLAFAMLVLTLNNNNKKNNCPTLAE